MEDGLQQTHPYQKKTGKIMAKLGFIGLGIMGKPMASHLVAHPIAPKRFKPGFASRAQYGIELA